MQKYIYMRAKRINKILKTIFIIITYLNIVILPNTLDINFMFLLSGTYVAGVRGGVANQRIG